MNRKPAQTDRAPSAFDPTTPAGRYARILEGLRPETLDKFSAALAEDVYFRDPFSETRGRETMAAIFREMFNQLGDIEFRVTDLMTSGDTCLMAWVMSGRPRGRGKVLGPIWRAEGMTRVRFNADGLVTEHVDHWDAASQLYEKFPLLGGVLMRLRRRIGHG